MRYPRVAIVRFVPLVTCFLVVGDNVRLVSDVSSSRHARVATVRHAAARDLSPRLGAAASDGLTAIGARPTRPGASALSYAVPTSSALVADPAMLAKVQTSFEDVEQRTMGARAPAQLVASFDGLGVGFVGPQGGSAQRNPSDNSLAVGPDHIVQVVNTRMAIFTKRGALFDTTGRVLFGAAPTNTVFRDFGGPCERRNNGDAVVRYDQLANRWLIVMPIFSREPLRPDEPVPGVSGDGARRSVAGRQTQPGAAERLVAPAAPPPGPDARPAQAPPSEKGSYAMCYAVSVGTDPFGPYYRYEFVRPLFPDYPRPAVWPDGYYVPSSTGDDVIQKHACVVDRTRMLRGEDATEQCVIIDGVNFLNDADLDGTRPPPPGAPNVVLAAGGTQLKQVLADDAIYAWDFHVDWDDPDRTTLSGPRRIPVAPYRYLCGGQLTSCVPQPGTERRLDAQGDKLMSRVVYRRIGNRESIVAVHSVNTAAGAGGVRWYEFRFDRHRQLGLFQQGTYAPDIAYRWMASPAMDARGNIGIGYSYGGTPHFAGQRFAGRLVGDPKGVLTLREAVLVDGEASQTGTSRWEDYTQTAVDPSDDCTIWYVGDYLKRGAVDYSTRIGAFRMPGCRPATASVPARGRRASDRTPAESRPGFSPPA
ncbi:MAG: hypothetical protein MNPFHGCM_00644 [Gemmatimonadaceae bacterium]|nr:hypothetical protein [Gemmatimonadaceae bacterium]